MCAAFLALAALAHAQVVDFVTVSKTQQYIQTTNSAPTTPTNFQFTTEIEGTSLSGITTPTLNSRPGTGPIGSYFYNASEDMWIIQQNFGTGPLLEAAYGVGNYNITAVGSTVAINLSNESPRFTAIPFATLSSGTISGGVLTWNVSQSLTITLSDPMPGGTAVIDHISLSIWGNNISLSADAFGNGTQSFTIPGTAGVNNTFIAGNSYTVEMEFVNISGGSGVSTFATAGGLNGKDYVGYYGRSTSFTIQAIPEPSTYAAIFGALALAGVMIHRRRRTA